MKGVRATGGWRSGKGRVGGFNSNAEALITLRVKFVGIFKCVCHGTRQVWMPWAKEQPKSACAQERRKEQWHRLAVGRTGLKHTKRLGTACASCWQVWLVVRAHTLARPVQQHDLRESEGDSGISQCGP
jgi:hypothetical protein